MGYRDGMVPSFALHHVSLHVRDVDASAAFYARVLGLAEMPNRVGLPHIRWFVLDAHRTLHLIGGDDVNGRDRAFSTHMALATPDLDAAMDHLRAEGVTWCNVAREPFGVQVRPDGVRQIYFQDPDGHWIEINAARDDA